jgi:hypothetical protein
MKELFIAKKFSPESERLIILITDILDDYEQQGYDLSLRQLYYQLVSKNIVENTERSYKNVGSLVSDARLAGMIDWNMIKDRGRETLENPHWESPADFLTSVAPQYKINLWENQNSYVEVMVEKQALEGVLEPVCRRLDVPFTANKGYSSSSALYEASKRFLHRYREGKECHVIYLGDHDPSGIDMSRDVEDRLDQFVKVSNGEHFDSEDEFKSVTMHRVALNMDQVNKLNPPENPAKLSDSRATGYIRKFGTKSWELDAIEPRSLANIVDQAVTDLMDRDQFEQDRDRMLAGRRKLVDAAAEFEDSEDS